MDPDNWWTQTTGKDMNVRDIYQPLYMRTINYGVSRVPAFIENYDVDRDLDYQRGHVWTLLQRKRYMGFILQGGKGLPIIVNAPELVSYGAQNYRKAQIVDGKQRLTTILKWVDGEFSALLSDGREVHVDHYKADEVAWRKLGAVDLVFGLVDLDRKQVLDYYLRLNSDGTRHTDEEIERVQQLLRQENNNG